MGRKKHEEVLNEIEKESGLAGSAVATVEKTEKKVNQFSDEYTLEIIDDFDPGADIFRIPKKDPNYEYRHLLFTQENLSIKTGNLLYQKGGWQICTKAHLLRIGIQPSFISPDGFYHVGGMVLGFMPKELYLKKEAAKLKKSNARMEQINRKIKEGDPTVGGKEVHQTMKGIQTAEALKM